uniref:Uncharacterized protein n=1 Tax=Anguilla anguilla TaxID=7936 RepID=A0A0E9S764_ANGAN
MEISCPSDPHWCLPPGIASLLAEQQTLPLCHPYLHLSVPLPLRGTPVICTGTAYGELCLI